MPTFCHVFMLSLSIIRHGPPVRGKLGARSFRFAPTMNTAKRGQMFRQRVKTLPGWCHYRRPTNSVQVFVESSTALILIIVGPNLRKEKICRSWTGQPNHREAPSYFRRVISYFGRPSLRMRLTRQSAPEHPSKCGRTSEFPALFWCVERSPCSMPYAPYARKTGGSAPIRDLIPSSSAVLNGGSGEDASSIARSKMRSSPGGTAPVTS